MILTRASKLALYALTEMARNPDGLVSASAIATRYDVSENHIAKVLQRLCRSELVESVRGAGGGYRLARAANLITMADVVTSIEGPIQIDACDDCPLRSDDGACREQATCSTHNLLSELASHVSYTLQSVTIATLARNRSLKQDLRKDRARS
ncbi:MAG: Rrf2 family transcriptional regulator [Polyangiaceae bacterium]